MKKKILAIILATVMMICCFSGCDLIVTDSEKDMAQTVAEVDISKSEDFQENGEYSAYKDVIRSMNITKRELVAYFVNSGYSYISSGMSYKDTFKALMDSMVNYKIILQYSMVYFFEASKDVTSEYYQAYSVEEYNAFVKDAKDEDERMLLTLKYFLDDAKLDKVGEYEKNGNVISYTRFQKAEYRLKQSINGAIDSQEQNYIKTVSSSVQNSTAASETRTTPTDVNTEKDDYFDPSYDIYTGKNASVDCGTYEKIAGSTPTTRRQGYNGFLNMLSSNSLITEEELRIAQSTEDGKGVTALKYYQSELLTQLQSALSQKLEDAFETKAASSITSDYLAQRYTERLQAQQKTYDKDSSSYETDLGSLSDSSFVLYTPDNATESDSTRYGFVYNILLPFSTQQSYKLTEYKNDEGLSEVELYEKRAELLNQIEGKDRRDSWFNGTTDYSFKATEEGVSAYNNGNNSDYLFFKESMTEADGDNARYGKLEKYYGRYPYNGSVSYNAEKRAYDLTPNKLNITEFLSELENYMNFALQSEGFDNRAESVSGAYTFNGQTFSVKNGKVDSYGKDLLGEDGKIDYSKFVYYVGQIGGMNVSANTLFVNDNAAYTALSAFNEMQFAYSTDTGCLNTYLGYSVVRGKTSYVGEFEYAAKLAISMGVGTYTVCPSDYGWHIIYCTYAFDKGSVYGDIDWAKFVTDDLIDEEKLTENSFEYFFYESIKSSLLSSYKNVLESKITNIYNKDACVTVYENRYSDYTSLENNYNSSSTSGNHDGHNHD